MVYANLKPIRATTHFENKPVPHPADYQRFIYRTGIVFERDLDTVAFALTKMPDPTGPNGPVAFSEIFVGRFDSARLKGYLGGIATARETYAEHDIFTIPIELPAGPASHIAPTGRTLRVAVIGKDMIAASNAPTPEQIHAMLDHARSTGGPFSGPVLLSGLYPEVPYFSSLWGIGALALPFGEDGHVAAFGLHLPFPDSTPFVASLRYTTSLGLRIEQIAPTEADAVRSAQKLTALLTIFHQMQQLQQASFSEGILLQMLESIKITQKSNRAILTARIPNDLLRALAQSH